MLLPPHRQSALEDYLHLIDQDDQQALLWETTSMPRETRDALAALLSTSRGHAEVLQREEAARLRAETVRKRGYIESSENVPTPDQLLADLTQHRLYRQAAGDGTEAGTSYLAMFVPTTPGQ